jgi:hypothetical protein
MWTMKEGRYLTTVKVKSKIGGIEDIYGPDVFFGLLGWHDRKFENVRVKFNVSDAQTTILEKISGRVHSHEAGSSVSRACMCLGVLIEAVQKCREPDITRNTIDDIKRHNVMDSATRRRVDDLINGIVFSNKTNRDDVINTLERYGDNDLGEYIWNVVSSEYPWDCKISYQPKISDISRLLNNKTWGHLPLDSDAMFKLWKGPENSTQQFRVSERMVKLLKNINEEFYGFTQAKMARGMWVKGTYVVAKWFADNNSELIEWYHKIKLVSNLHTVYCRGRK